MPQNDFNHEKEPTPERKWWNVFERQSEFEQPVEENRAERAKELKSATSERGHFWERFFADRNEPDEIIEIAPKGEKVRKKWRALLRRKSETQVEEFKDNEPETIDSYWLAQLMVAERILTLNERLGETEPKSRERKETKTELDVLGLLSEKLSDPDIAVPKEIEQTYQSIIEVIESGDTGIEATDIPMIQETTQPKGQEPEQTRARSFQRYGAAVIIALKAAVKKHEDETDQEPARPLPAHPGPGIGSPRPILSPTAPKPSVEQPPAAHPHTSPNILPHVALTAAVITAEKEYRSVEQSVFTAPPVAQPVRNPSPERPVSTPVIPENTKHPKTQEISDEIAAYKPQKKFDHMSMLELLQIAQSVPIGNGEYLARAYQSGKIDRDGLIAVLKTAGRKGNYQLEFRRRSAEYIAIKHQPHTPQSARQTTIPAPDKSHTGIPDQEPATPEQATQHPYIQRKLNALVNAQHSSTALQTIRVAIIAAIIIVTLIILY